ncbi:CaiB/BaiF CoA transferase family protein [Streptomyces mirabilis]|uniref:CaiB/BaiF CoA transferase family protein n=1 Tax=Streptomyces mirabilis TaxID=68239 RepID=UPI0036D918DF
MLARVRDNEHGWSRMAQQVRALAGTRVIDAATMVAGPLGASILADFGADVVKVEPIAGDESRTFGPGRDGMSGVYAGVNRNKRAIALDLRTEEGRELFHELCAGADVLIENMLPTVRAKFGLTAEELRERHPYLICLNVSGYGDSGPSAGRPALDPVAQALTGMIQGTGDPDGRGIKAGPPVADSSAGYLVAVAALVSLFARQKTGAGQNGSVSLVASLFHLQSPWLGQYMLADYVAPRVGNASNFYAPYNAYATRDGGAVHIVAFNDRHFERFVKAAGAEHLLDDERFTNAASRLAHREELDLVLAPWFAERDRDDIVTLLTDQNIICAPVLAYDEAVDHPQIRALEMVVGLESEALGEVRVPGLPIKLSDTPGRVERPPTALGEHTAELLKELGHNDQDIARLLAARVVR